MLIECRREERPYEPEQLINSKFCVSVKLLGAVRYNSAMNFQSARQGELIYLS